MRIICILAGEWIYPSLVINGWFKSFLSHYDHDDYVIHSPFSFLEEYGDHPILGYDGIFVAMHGFTSERFISGVTVLSEKFLFNNLSPSVDLAMNVCYVNPPQSVKNNCIYWNGALEGISIMSPMKEVLRIQLDTYMQSKNKETALKDSFEKSKAYLKEISHNMVTAQTPMLIHNYRIYSYREKS